MTDDNVKDMKDIILEEEGELTIEPENATDIVKKLKEKLKACEAERKEYLDGWQRMKADVINKQKENDGVFGRGKDAGVISLFENILPALDSFEMARKGAQWEAVDPVWRSGIDMVVSQLYSGLADAGITRYGAEGEVFDPLRHDPVGEREGEAHTVLDVVRSGFETKEGVIRAAQVIVGK